MKQSLTEKANEGSLQLDELSPLEISRLMWTEDATIKDAIEPALPSISRAIELVVERWEKGGRVFIAGAGTSGRIGVLDALELGPTFSVEKDRWIPIIAGGKGAMWEPLEQTEDSGDAILSELRRHMASASDVIIGISASGSTPFVLEALKFGSSIGAGTVSVSCNEGAAASKMSTVAIEAATGPEIIRGSTRLKAGTAQKMIINMISTGAMVKAGKVYGNEMVDMQLLNKKLVKRAHSMIAEIAGVPETEARNLLENSGKDVKTAIFMGMTGADKEKAETYLHESNGRLKQALSRFFNK
ncbi:N-acetylmuramic acid 6-phosphate etherase [Bacillus marinisedimentorum]|uniref:N-acetylmuramic acid 6-phosphate etherase n=1 Tax=Bacillus marinisedimentorum TaxID=1821260 RepID=UPI0008721122|nr:N-acetylmuramic acid 6-phosphate etherase [Bacillus marinisedimentorum]